MKAIKYMNLVNDLYDVNLQLDQEQLRNADNALKPYKEYDIEKAIRYYYSKKNTSVAPKISQIVAILSTWVDDKHIGLDIDTTMPEIKHTLPTTNIYTIKSVFDKLVGVLVRAGIIRNQDGKFENTNSLVDLDTDLPMLNPQQKLRWLVDDAKQERPDLFCKFDNTTWIEDLAIALQNNLIKIKVRDWSKVFNTQDRTFNLNDMVNRI